MEKTDTARNSEIGRRANAGKGFARTLCALGLMGSLVLMPVAQAAYAAPTDDLATAEAQLSSRGDELQALEEQLDQQSDDLEQTKSQMYELQDKISSTEQELSTAQDELSSRIRTSYKSGATNFLDVLLNSSSFRELISNFYINGKFDQSDAEALQSVKDLKTQLEDEKTQLEQTQQQQEQQLADTQDQVAEYQQKLSEAQSYYDTLSAEVQQQVAEQAAADQSNGGATAAVEAIQSNQAASTQGGTSPNTNTTTITNTNTNTNTNNDNGGSSNSGSNSGSNAYGGAGLASAYSMIGVPYVWGGTSSSGVDCSGLVVYCYGWGRGRTTYDMIASLKASGDWKTDMSQLSAGDLVFTSAGHVGIFIGNGYMIHAPSPGRTVCTVKIWSFIGGGTY